MTISQGQVFALLAELAGQKNAITTPRIFVAMTGSLNAGVLLGQIVYWSGHTRDADGWFYKKDEEWTEEIGLSGYQVGQLIKNKLCHLGVETKLKKAHGAPTTHYRIKGDMLVAAILEFLQNPISRNSKMDSGETPDSLTSTTPSTLLRSNDGPGQQNMFSAPTPPPAPAAPKPPALSTQLSHAFERCAEQAGWITNMRNAGTVIRELLALVPSPSPDEITMATQTVMATIRVPDGRPGVVWFERIPSAVRAGRAKAQQATRAPARAAALAVPDDDLGGSIF